MSFKIGFYISVAFNVVLAILTFFKTGINNILTDWVKRRRDEKERIRNALKKLKNASEVFHRKHNTLIFKIFTDGFRRDEEFDSILKENEKTRNELNNILVDCPNEVISEVDRLKDKHIEVMDDIALKASKGIGFTKGDLNKYIKQLDECYKKARKAIGVALKR